MFNITNAIGFTYACVLIRIVSPSISAKLTPLFSLFSLNYRIDACDLHVQRSGREAEMGEQYRCIGLGFRWYWKPAPRKCRQEQCWPSLFILPIISPFIQLSIPRQSNVDCILFFENRRHDGSRIHFRGSFFDITCFYRLFRSAERTDNNRDEC